MKNIHFDLSKASEVLAKLYAIPFFGKRVNMGSGNYAAKFRIEKTEATSKWITTMKARHPETLVYFTTKQTIIFGGTYPAQSCFWEDAKFIMTMGKKKCTARPTSKS